MNNIIIHKNVSKKAKKYKIKKEFDKLINELKEDAEHGIPLPNHKWPLKIYKNHKQLLNETNNLWKDEVVHGRPGYRLYYTIRSMNEIDVIVLELDPHTKTDNYKFKLYSPDFLDLDFPNH